jgi:hypothetical protein
LQHAENEPSSQFEEGVKELSCHYPHCQNPIFTVRAIMENGEENNGEDGLPVVTKAM